MAIEMQTSRSSSTFLDEVQEVAVVVVVEVTLMAEEAGVLVGEVDLTRMGAVSITTITSLETTTLKEVAGEEELVVMVGTRTTTLHLQPKATTLKQIWGLHRNMSKMECILVSGSLLVGSGDVFAVQ